MRPSIRIQERWTSLCAEAGKTALIMGLGMAAPKIILKRMAAAAVLAFGVLQAGSLALAEDSNAAPDNRLHLGERPDAQGLLAPRRRMHGNEGVTFEDIGSMLTADGYGQVLSIRRAGDVWNVVAVRNNGAIHKLSISAESGEILERRKSGWTRVPVPGVAGAVE